MTTPAIACDACAAAIRPDEDCLVLIARPYRRVLCLYCKRRLEETIELIIRMDEREHNGDEPRLIC